MPARPPATSPTAPAAGGGDRPRHGRRPRRPNPFSWARERVGTIHTFQGKEAEAVVLLLGAPQESSAGARWWAGSAPNLLNVAVSRAKRRLDVIGSRRAWKDVGVFRSLASKLPRAGWP